LRPKRNPIAFCAIGSKRLKNSSRQAVVRPTRRSRYRELHLHVPPWFSRFVGHRVSLPTTGSPSAASLRSWRSPPRTRPVSSAARVRLSSSKLSFPGKPSRKRREATYADGKNTGIAIFCAKARGAARLHHAPHEARSIRAAHRADRRQPGHEPREAGRPVAAESFQERGGQPTTIG
jgi:hypothetical protein